MQKTKQLGIALCGALWLAGCGAANSDGASAACSMGETRSCTCTGDAQGAQACTNGTSFSACSCAAQSGAAGTSAQSNAGKSGGVASAGMNGGGAGTGATGNAGNAGTGVGGASGGGNSGCGLGLDVPAQGFQVCDIGTTIKAGEETEYCEVVVLPGSPSDEYYVNRLQTAMTPHSHHLIIMAAEPGSSNEAKMTPGSRVPCKGAEGVYGQGMINVTGSQLPTSDAKYPAGVGKIYHGGQKLSFDYHYANSSSAPAMARAALNMYTVDKSAIQHIAHQFGMYNFAFSVAPGQTAHFDKSCTFTRDVMVYALTRHTHKWATDFTVWWAGGPKDTQEIWTSHDYETETNYLLPNAPVLMKAGTGFKFRCNFDNTTDHALTFGTTTTNEMCILFGQWWDTSEMGHGDDQGCR